MIQRTIRTLSVLAVCAGVSLSSCAPDEDERVAQADVLAQQAGGAIDGGVVASSDGGMSMKTPCSALHLQYSPGISEKFGDVTVKLLSATPAPPRALLENNWVLQLLDASGQPLAGAQLRNVDTGMIAHGHPGQFLPLVEPLELPGQWAFRELDFSMPGPWEITFDVLPSGATRATQVIFRICVE